MTKLEQRNKYCFGLGTIGRDMFYAFESNTLIYFLSNILSLPIEIFAITSLLLSVLRVVDAVNDPITGMIVENIRSPWGKYKPAILVGGVVSAAAFIGLFAGIGTGATFVVFFSISYVIWDIAYGINDIGYWTLVPALTSDQKSRENIGAFARICANIGLFVVMIGWEPITKAMGNTKEAWLTIAVVLSVLFILFLLITLFGVKEPRQTPVDEEKSSLKEMFQAIFGNDQLLWTTVSMALFMIGYCATTGLAVYYIQYIYGDLSMYSILAAAVGVSQLLALIVFPLFSKKYNRKQLYTIATILVLIGYVIFLFADTSIVLIASAAVVLFIGEAFIQLLMLMFLADTIEYGQWKLGKRSESVTFSVQPFINKIGGAISTGIISVTVIFSGIKAGDVAAETIDSSGKLIIKLAMLVVPLLFIVGGYFIYLKKYKIDEVKYKEILEELEKRR